MIKLLNAGFARLRKSKLFCLLMLFTVGFALCVNFSLYRDMKTHGEHIEVDQVMLIYAISIGIVIAIFSSLFLGAEYSDGTIRNKICIGHRRIDIYVSNLLVTAITSLFSYIVFIVVTACVGIPLLGPIKMPMTELLALLGCILITVIAYSAIFTFIAMVISNKAITAIVSIMLAFGLMMAALTCFQVISTQEFVSTISMVDGEMIEQVIRNPKYPSVEKRMVYQILFDINPAGQMYQLAGMENPNVIILPLYSLGILIVFTATGIVLFNKKDIK